MSRQTRQYLVSGLVQGVGFRAFARRAAAEVGVTGWTRNLGDGRVEVLAQGADDALVRYAAALARGPAHGRVDDVTAIDRPDVAERFADFEQRKDAPQPCPAV